jgi:ComF family protein
VTAKPLLPSTRDLTQTPIRRIADGLLNLLYPESCLVCSAPVARLQDRGICPACWQRALRLRITGAVCPSCGIPYQSFAEEPAHLCGKCILSLPPYSGARAFGYYSSELSRMVQALKFSGRRDLAPLLAPLLASTFLEFWQPEDVDLIVPVPLHPNRKKERGFNQAALLGRALARLLGMPCEDRVLRRARSTPPQVGLSDAERARNVAGAFVCRRPDRIRARRLLLVDDVMTTGSTAASAASALLNAGAARVCVLTLARAVAGAE